MTKKLTKKDHFNALKSIPEVAQNEMLVAFIDHEIELLNRKNSTATGEKKLTATQVANEEIKQAILDGMTPKRLYTITELMKEIPVCNGMTNQRVSALVRQLKDAGLVNRIEDKRKALFEKVC